MSKELTPLQAFDNLCGHLDYDTTDYMFNGGYEEDAKIIETALKRLAVYENYDINLNETNEVEKALTLNARLTLVDKVMDSQQRLLQSVSSDEIKILNSVFNSQVKKLNTRLNRLEELEKAFHTLSKEDEKTKKLLSKEIEKNRALEIIKEKKVDIDLLLSSLYVTHYNDFINEEKFGEKQLTQKEFNLLREVLL